MRALICPYSRPLPWCAEFFPERSLCTLPLAGKEYSEYLIDTAARLGLGRILLLDYCFDPEFRRRLGDGSRWSLSLDYRGAGIRRNIYTVLSENHAFVGEDECVIFFGPILPEPESIEQLCGNLEPVSPGEATEDGVYVYRAGSLMRSRVPMRRLETLQEYFELNFQLLQSPGQHVLPGYLVENGVHTGMNAVIMPGCRISPPVLLCDNISLERDCILEDGVIVGQNVVVDRGNSLKHTIILSNTFIGKHMELHDKILDSGRIIDPLAGEYIDLGDCGIAGDLRRYQRKVDPATVCEYVLAAFMAVVGFVPFLLCRLVGTVYRNELWCYKLSMDCYPKLWRVLRGKCSLVCRKQGGTGDWVFRFSESFSIGRDRYQHLLDDIYFIHHRSAMLVLKTVVKAMINRMFTTRDAFQNTLDLH